MGFMMMIMMMGCRTATYNIVMIIVFDVLGFFLLIFFLSGGILIAPIPTGWNAGELFFFFFLFFPQL